MMAGGTGPTAQGMNNNMAAMGYGAPQQVSIDDYHRKGIAQVQHFSPGKFEEVYSLEWHPVNQEVP